MLHVTLYSVNIKPCKVGSNRNNVAFKPVFSADLLLH